jgi:hypothetical protein
MERDEQELEWARIEWRYDQARRVGVPADEATRFAQGDGDVEQLRRLIVKNGCDPQTAARIVA